MRALLIAGILLASPYAAHADEAIFPITGTFSDITCVEEEGDVIGSEITIVAGFEGVSYQYFALVQFAEGVASIPQLVPVEINGDRISFKTDYLGQLNVMFSGKVDKEGIEGKFGKPLNIKVKLARKNSFWKTPGDLCFS